MSCVYSRSPKYDILLAGYHGFGNLGDELLALSAVNLLVESGVEKNKIAILSVNPDESRGTLGVDAFGRGLPSKSLTRALASSRAMLLAGGGVFQDSTSVRSCFYYWALVRRALLASCRVAAISQSIGPLSNSLSRWMTRDALMRCRYLSVRDDPSLAVARSLGLDALESPDLVMGMSLPEVEAREDEVVLINIRPIPGRGELEKSAERVIKAARACAAGGLTLRGIALADEDASEMERLIASGELPPCEVVPVKNLADFVSASGDAFAAVGMRLHFGILSMKRGLRVALAPYDPKVSGFAEKWGALCPDFKGITENSDIMGFLTKAFFEDKKRPDHDEVRRALRGAFRIALSRILEEK
ncbi:MAG: polysaccharide pyruvyl transferase family protein [Synergistaceae bacterium]|jgi:polysaccharide pyruvyl transferase CsaB|nr:polysaccharide pyruvyl transferase family protein [Synergistaceae bacterium]